MIDDGVALLLIRYSLRIRIREPIPSYRVPVRAALCDSPPLPRIYTRIGVKYVRFDRRSTGSDGSTGAERRICDS